MIDVENDIYTIVATALREQFPGIFVSGEYVPSPASFPAVTLVEADNYVDVSMSTVNIEDCAVVMYALSVYSNKTNGKKQEAKKIADFADEQMRKLGFTRTSRVPVPNLADATIYRLESRYEAVIGYGNQDNTYLIYQNV